MLSPRDHQLDGIPAFQFPVNHTDQHDHTDVRIEPGIKYQRPGGCGHVAHRWRDPIDHRLKQRFDSRSLLGGNRQYIGSVQSDHVLDLLGHLVGVRRGKVDFIDHGNQFEIGIHREIGIGQSLGLNPLSRIHHQKRALTGSQGA